MSMRTPRALFAGWIDDAALFPPGNAPVPQAFSEHRALRLGPYADLLGPLLISTTAAASTAALARGVDIAPGGPTAITVVARPGTPVQDLLDAVGTLRLVPALRVVGVELAHDDTGRWRDALDLGLPLALEVPRHASWAAFDAIDEAQEEGHEVIAKLRTQATDQTPAPTVHELADFLVATRQRGLPFKLTGGLHHALPQGEGRAAEHGCLNVLVAAAVLTSDGPYAELVSTLSQTRAAPLVEVVEGLTRSEVADLRTSFRSFGCCGVLDPIGELADLGLLPAAP